MERRRTDYKICDFCGASLDVGEKCDCIETQAFKMTQEPPQKEKHREEHAKIQKPLYGAKWALERVCILLCVYFCVII